MNNLKEIDGKYYQKCEVIMLQDKVGLQPSQLCLVDENLEFATQQKRHLFNSKCKGQHLYITSNEEIKEDDWYVLLANNKPIFILKCTGPGNYVDAKKIIASTDTLLGLPQPSQDFLKVYVEEYNKGNVITEVLVEYEKYDISSLTSDTKTYPNLDIETVKVNGSNKISIKKLKDSWSREEHLSEIKRISKLLYFSPNKDVDFNDEEELYNWIEKNL